MGVKHIVVFINKIDMTDDQEMLELVSNTDASLGYLYIVPDQLKEMVLLGKLFSE